MMPETRFNKVGTVTKKHWESGMLKKTPVWNIPQVNRLNGNR